MKAHWAVAAVLCLTSCDVINPLKVYQEAGRQLRFSLDRVEPSCALAFPLSESRLTLRLILGVDNPTQVHFQSRQLTGRVSLEQQGASHAVGGVSLAQGLDLAPGARSALSVDLNLGYRDVEQAWGPLQRAIRGEKGLWRLDGEMMVDVLGIPFALPLHASRPSGE